MTAISPVEVQVALNNDDEAQISRFSRTWLVPRNVLNLSAGKLTLSNIYFLVADADFTYEGILVRNPVLQNFKKDSRAIIEEQRKRFDERDLEAVFNPSV